MPRPTHKRKRDALTDDSPSSLHDVDTDVDIDVSQNPSIGNTGSGSTPATPSHQSIGHFPTDPLPSPDQEPAGSPSPPGSPHINLQEEDKEDKEDFKDDKEEDVIRVAPSGGNVHFRAGQTTEKKIKKEKMKVMWGPNVSGYSFEKVIPVGVEMVCKWKDNLYHMCKVLENKEWSDQDKIDFPNELNAGHRYMYYIHYLAFNRRMDEWVPRVRMAFKEELSAEEKAICMNETVDQDHHEHGDLDEESLKAHEEVTKVKNIDCIVLGANEIETWYFSPFPPEVGKVKKLFFCEFCFKYFKEQQELFIHMQLCKQRSPPGDEIYRSEETNVTIAMFEVDGAKDVTYCQNLCYIAKLFLDHKTLQYDTLPFLFYILCELNETGYHFVGYFSKEKHSEESYNVACILTLPCHQRKGYGAFLISFSYELSKIEKKVGSPEKPLSDLGAVSYRSYWSKVIMKLLVSERERLERENKPQEISIQQISKMTSITNDDIISTLRHLNVIKYLKGEHILALPPESEITQPKKKRKFDSNAVYVRPCDPSKVHWTPYYTSTRRARSQW